MKILQINKFFFLKGGAERYFFDLCELLTLKGNQVLVWSTKHQKNFNWPDQSSFVSYADYDQKEGLWKDLKKIGRIFWNFEASKKLKGLIKKERPEIAHLHNFHHHFSPSIILTLKKHRIPIVMTLHDYKMFCPNYHLIAENKICLDCLKRKYGSCLRQRCVKSSYLKSLICVLEAKWQNFLEVAQRIDAFIAPSLYMKNKAIQWGIPREKIWSLPYFLFPEEPAKAKRKKEKRYFLYFGRLSPEKGIEVLIRAFDQLAQKNPQWQLKIAGQGPARKKLEQLPGIDYQSIKFLGQQRGQGLKKLIQGAYLVVVPSIWPENYPYAVLESFVQGKPVIGSKIGGIPQLVKDNKTGWLFKPNDVHHLTDKLKYAIKYPGVVKEMGRRARRVVKEITNPQRHYQRLMKIYERISAN